MPDRVVVAGSCLTRCPSCEGCFERQEIPSLAEVLALPTPAELTLGGGDATRWPYLRGLLAHNVASADPKRIWVEAPAAAFTKTVLEELAGLGLHGVLVQIEGLGAKMLNALRVGDGEAVIANAEALGLKTRVRLCVRPKTFPIVAPLAVRLHPRPVFLELVRQDWGQPPVPIFPGPVQACLLQSSNLELSSHRRRESGYLPPCVMPEAWRARSTAWRATLNMEGTKANTALPACASCALNLQCQWNDPAALDEETRTSAQPIAQLPPVRRRVENPVPESIVRQRPRQEVICVTPWTSMEITEPDGRTRQCCNAWTAGHRGSVVGSSLREIWNGPGYQEARRIMSSPALDKLCLPVCPRLYDHKYAEQKFGIVAGSERFVRNQLLMAEEIAQRREIMRSLPLGLTLCASTYCNYNCIMCDHGRTPRRDLPDSIWEELPELLPTLQTLTLLGGEPFANHHTWEFLRKLDVKKYPDVVLELVTNGSLLTPAALKQLENAPFGGVTISFNAGTAEAYEAIQRPAISFEQLVKHLDALIAFRDSRPTWFGISLSFVVQPAGVPTLRQFGEIAHRRNLRIRLLPLDPAANNSLDFYQDADESARVVEHLDAFLKWVERVRPEWLPDVRAARTAVLQETAARAAKTSGIVALRIPATAE